MWRCLALWLVMRQGFSRTIGAYLAAVAAETFELNTRVSEMESSHGDRGVTRSVGSETW